MPRPSERTRIPRGWTASQRSVLVVLAAGLLVYCAVLAIRNRAHIDDPQPPVGARADEVASRIDPNTASQYELSLLPSIGPVRAGEIIAYRQRVQGREPGGVAFARPDDLMRVRGIGPALLAHKLPHLKFPPPPTTAPTSQRSGAD